jgi:clan AA aspartic protease (TIGR02281 family)
MRLDPNANSIIVPVEVYGNGEYRAIDMLVDTGATFVSVPVGFLEKLGYDLAQSGQHLSLHTANGVRSAPLFTVQRISVFGIEASNIDTLCMTLPGENRLRGLLGLSFLRLFDMDVHFKQRVLRFQ